MYLHSTEEPCRYFVYKALFIFGLGEWNRHTLEGERCENLDDKMETGEPEWNERLFIRRMY
ncbi:hypothetical protein K7H05_52570, partial [Bacillus sp. ZZQ-131]